jgi:hypothetical protein
MPDRPPVHRPYRVAVRKHEPARPDDSVRANRFRQRAAWKRFRLYQLSHKPLCEDCQERGSVTAATEVHHAEMRLAARLTRGLSAFDNVRSLCTSCHSARTRRGE